MSYGLLGLKNQMEGEALSGLQDLSKEQHQNKMFKDQADQQQKFQRKQSQVGMATSGAMMGATVGGPVGAVIGGAVGLIAGSFM
jgi:hypothetical protein